MKTYKAKRPCATCGGTRRRTYDSRCMSCLRENREASARLREANQGWPKPVDDEQAKMKGVDYGG